jgi:hypothetical protein
VLYTVQMSERRHADHGDQNHSHPRHPILLIAIHISIFLLVNSSDCDIYSLKPSPADLPPPPAEMQVRCSCKEYLQYLIAERSPSAALNSLGVNGPCCAEEVVQAQSTRRYPRTQDSRSRTPSISDWELETIPVLLTPHCTEPSRANVGIQG